MDSKTAIIASLGCPRDSKKGIVGFPRESKKELIGALGITKRGSENRVRIQGSLIPDSRKGLIRSFGFQKGIDRLTQILRDSNMGLIGSLGFPKDSKRD